MPSTKVCSKCGTPGSGKLTRGGNGILELALWLLLFPVGIIYSIMRSSNKIEICRACGSTDMVPADSPLGKKLSQA